MLKPKQQALIYATEVTVECPHCNKNNTGSLVTPLAIHSTVMTVTSNTPFILKLILNTFRTKVMTQKTPWSSMSDNALIQNYHHLTASELAILLGKSRSAILRRARQLAIPKKSEASYKNKRYTHAEKAFILDNINKMGPGAVAAVLRRSEEAVRIFCKRHNIKITFFPTWTPGQTRYLKKNGLQQTIEEISHFLNKSPQAIRKYANEHGIPLAKAVRSGKPGPWTHNEKIYLASHLHLPHHVIAKHLGRTAEAVARYASANGILK